MTEYNLLSIVAGTETCNAKCPFCISKMTPDVGMTRKPQPVNWRNFGIAARLAKQGGVTSAMITGKGEPTLYPEQITDYLRALEKQEFPLVDLQTNGIPIAERPEKYEKHLADWYEHNLTTIAISVVHYEPEKNRQVYLPHKKEYIDLPELIENLHGHGFSVRLACTMLRGAVDSASELEKMVQFAQEHKVEQLTLRPVNAPAVSNDADVQSWAREHMLSREQRETIEAYLSREAHLLQETSYGAKIYDLHGQNVCLTNSLTAPVNDCVRQLIFFPDGHLRYDWQYEGAIVL